MFVIHQFLASCNATGVKRFATGGHGIFCHNCLRQILQNISPHSNTSHGLKVNHFDWNFLSSLSLLEGLESVELVLQDGPCPSNSTVASLWFLCPRSVEAVSASNFVLRPKKKF